MIVNDKFKVPGSSAPRDAMKHYYNNSVSENHWNIKQLSSKKIAKYYHNVNERFMHSSLSPTYQLLLQHEEDIKSNKDKARKNIALARKRIKDRKLERIEVGFI